MCVCVPACERCVCGVREVVYVRDLRMLQFVWMPQCGPVCKMECGVRVWAEGE